MTRTHAARQLLALGPISFGEFVTVTGWPISACRRVLSYLVDDLGEADRLGRLYQLTNGKQLPDLHPLATEVRPANGEAPVRTLRVQTAMGVPTSIADVREAKAGCCGRCSSEGCMASEGVNHG